MRYELIREVPNLCKRNQMRDVFVSEVETDDPEQYVRQLVEGEILSLWKEPAPDGVTIWVESGKIAQKFCFTLCE